MEKLELGKFTLTWLNGGVTYLDGGAMFGVVPKPLWSRKYPCNEKNQIEIRCDPILIQTGSKYILVESGIGIGKLTAKQKRNFGVLEESIIDESLAALGLTREDIDIVAMTHLHFDHACGLTIWQSGEFVPAFPKAKIMVSVEEWEEARAPTIRSRTTYWEQNWRPIQDQIETFKGEAEIVPGMRMIRTGGHCRGHSIILWESEGEKGIHLADLMPTHAHQNPLWVLAYDDYPVTSAYVKKKWVNEALQNSWWVIFYHDAFCRAIRWNKDGEVIDQVERKRPDGKKKSDFR